MILFSTSRQIAGASWVCAVNLTVRQIAAQLGVSEATLYKHIPKPRTNFSA
jgi:transposase